MECRTTTLLYNCFQTCIWIWMIKFSQGGVEYLSDLLWDNFERTIHLCGFSQSLPWYHSVSLWVIVCPAPSGIIPLLYKSPLIKMLPWVDRYVQLGSTWHLVQRGNNKHGLSNCNGLYISLGLIKVWQKLRWNIYLLGVALILSNMRFKICWTPVQDFAMERVWDPRVNAYHRIIAMIMKNIVLQW